MNVQTAQDVCALPLVRRLAAMLNRDPLSLTEGQALPRGWHVILFNVPTMQSLLKKDGSASLGIEFPDVGFPRLMLGGRKTEFLGDIPIGAHVRRETQLPPVEMKNGRSGSFALVRVQHTIRVEDHPEPVLTEAADYILRQPSSESRLAAPAAPPTQAALPDSTVVETICPDAPLLFRYSSITDNPHRIHYDLPYATGVEGYPTLVVNGSIPAVYLLECFRRIAGREPQWLASRNIAPMYSERKLYLSVQRDEEGWRLWARDDSGAVTFDARAG